MRKLSSITISAAVAIVAAAAIAPSWADEDKKPVASAPKPQQEEKPEARPAIPIYRPRGVTNPARTVGGGSRGPGEGFPSVWAIVPDHVGRSGVSQPTLLWWVASAPPAGATVEFTLLDEDGIDPMVSAVLPTPSGPEQLNRIALAEHGVELVPGGEYEWSIALVVDAEERSKDIVATGWIAAVERSPELEAQLGAEGADPVRLLASEGLWYDALTELDALLARSPGDGELLALRSQLLREVGLEAVAQAAL